MKSNKLNIFICVTAFFLVIGSVIYFTDKEDLLSSLWTINLWWVGAAVLFMVIYWLLEAAILQTMIRPMHPQQKFMDTFRVSMSGQYFNCITPFSSGGQPFQAYYLKKQGVPLSLGLNALISKFIVYQVMLVALSTVLLCLRLEYYQERVSGFAFLVVIGFACNVGVMLVLLSLALFKNFTKKFSHAIIFGLGKLHLLKDPEKKRQEMDEEIDQFHDAFKMMMKNLKMLFVSAALTLVQLLIFMAIPYLIYRAFGQSSADFITMISAQAFVMMVSSFVPIPGAEGGAEGSFYFFFKDFYAAGQLGLALVIWRTITFYFTIAVGGVYALSGSRHSAPASDENEDAQALPEADMEELPPEEEP